MPLYLFKGLIMQLRNETKGWELCALSTRSCFAGHFFTEGWEMTRINDHMWYKMWDQLKEDLFIY